jgi:NADH-quinone oxidoreductase subunit J
MLTGRVAGKPLEADSKNKFMGTLVGLGFLFLLSYALYITTFNFLPPPADDVQQHHLENTGMQIMSDYVAPFELAGILLLISLVGAAVISSFTKIKKNAAG